MRTLLFKVGLLGSVACGVALLVSARHGADSTQSERRIHLGNAESGSLYAVTIAIKDPAQFQNRKSVEVSIEDARGGVAAKRLHGQDLDFYATIRPRARGAVT